MLLRGDLYLFASLMNSKLKREGNFLKLLLTSIQQVIDLGMKNGGTDAKICGSGGGGSVLFFAEDRRNWLVS